MDWGSVLNLKQMLLTVLASTCIVCLHGNPVTGVDHNLHCVTDYLLTVNCTLNISTPENTCDTNICPWLTFKETSEGTEFACMLTNTNGDYFCSAKKSDPSVDDYSLIFMDIDIFAISLCHNESDGSKTCELLDEEYMPVANIKPNAPCCLTVSHSSGQYHFTWNSTYEEYGPFTNLPANLMYQLHYYKRGDELHVMSHEISTDSMNYSMDDQKLVLGAEYAARVRSSPNHAFYEGQWSDWSPEVHWKMESAAIALLSQSHHFGSGLDKVFIPLCVMLLLVLISCYAPVKKWRQNAFIPTPAPYFQTLYSDCQGDFKSWVVTQENAADMLKAEETVQIDSLSKCADTQEEECQPKFHHQVIGGSTYSNLTDLGFDASLLGIPYAVSTMAPPSAPGSSLQSLTLSSEPGSPVEEDSGCWLCSHTSLNRDPPFYCNEYCTLSTFQQTYPVTGEHFGKSCPAGMIMEDAMSGEDDVCME